MDKKKIYSKWFLVPSMTIFTVMFVIPLLLSLFFSLTVWNFDGFTFCGIDNLSCSFRSSP